MHAATVAPARAPALTRINPHAGRARDHALMDVDLFDAMAGAHAAKLRRAYPALRRCEALLEDRPPHGGRSFVINREDESALGAALEEAFAAARASLEDHVRQ